jgi:hypothetical protein
MEPREQPYFAANLKKMKGFKAKTWRYRGGSREKKIAFFICRRIPFMVIYWTYIPRKGGAGRIKVKGAEALTADILLSFIAIDF